MNNTIYVPTWLYINSSAYLNLTKKCIFRVIFCISCLTQYACIKPYYGRSCDKPCIWAYLTATWAN